MLSALPLALASVVTGGPSTRASNSARTLIDIHTQVKSKIYSVVTRQIYFAGLCKKKKKQNYDQRKNRTFNIILKMDTRVPKLLKRKIHGKQSAAA